MNEHEKTHGTAEPHPDAMPPAMDGGTPDPANQNAASGGFPGGVSGGAPGGAPGGTQAGAQAAPLSQDAVMQAASARIAELEAEVAELKDRWMRSEAEIANVRARSRREVDETRQYAVQKFATDVVEAAENLRRGIASLPPPTADQPEIVGKLREGLEGVERSFVSLLERNGIKGEDPTGAVFDPKLHQAMAEQETEAQPAGTVLHSWSSAWTLNGRLLRPAMVVVAKAPPVELAGAAGPAAKLDTTA